MSHQTGIKSSDELKEAFSDAKRGEKRLLKVEIADEKLQLKDSENAKGSWEDDYDAFVLPRLESTPCYILYRLDRTSDEGSHQWILLAYVPDTSEVRQKMLYAATRSTLKMEFGGGNIVDEIYGNTKDDVSLDGYQKHLEAAEAPPPLTEQEEQMQILSEADKMARIEISASTRQSHLHGVSFPTDDETVHHLEKLRDKKLIYVQLSIDLGNEKICFVKSDATTTSATLGSHVPDDHSRYHFFRYKHQYEGDDLDSVVFVYSSPGYKCSVRERMLYSSCKATVVDLAKQLDIDVVKAVEIESGSELSEAFLMDEVHPKQHLQKQLFARPPGPSNRRRSSPRPQSAKEN
ncbi:twinfilin-1-like [Oscarella lobularis]|uniref:twinfilin-1-like n=1 Tax=Oscarella lobularis TaxID=121494 RepID=UPI0033136BEF